MKWLKVAVATTAEAVEAVAHRLETLGAGGVVIEDPGLLARRERESPLDYFDGSVASPAEFQVIAYWLDNAETTGKLASLRGFLTELPDFGLDPGTARITTAPVDEDDWAHAWKAHYRPQRFGRIVICPSWERCEIAEDQVEVRLDPGMAFGTGGHPSTALCLEALSRHVRGGETMVDVGTGSGILAIAAAKLGAGPVLACDLDPQAVQVALDNVTTNGLSDRVRCVAGDAREILLATEPADLVVANIIAEVIIALACELRGAVRSGGTLFAAGIVEAKAAAVRAAVESTGLTCRGEYRQEGWVCLEFVSLGAESEASS